MSHTPVDAIPPPRSGHGSLFVGDIPSSFLPLEGEDAITRPDTNFILR